MSEDYKFSAIVCLRDASPDTKKKAKDNLEKMGFNIIYVASGNTITVSCPKSVFEEVFKTQVEKFATSPTQEHCKLSAPVQIPKKLKKWVENVVIAPLPIYQKPE